MLFVKCSQHGLASAKSTPVSPDPLSLESPFPAAWDREGGSWLWGMDAHVGGSGRLCLWGTRSGLGGEGPGGRLWQVSGEGHCLPRPAHASLGGGNKAARASGSRK